MCNLMEMVPGCQSDLIASHPLFSREISCPVADRLHTESKVYREPTNQSKCQWCHYSIAITV